MAGHEPWPFQLVDGRNDLGPASDPGRSTQARRFTLRVGAARQILDDNEIGADRRG